MTVGVAVEPAAPDSSGHRLPMPLLVRVLSVGAGVLRHALLVQNDRF